MRKLGVLLLLLYARLIIGQYAPSQEASTPCGHSEEDIEEAILNDPDEAHRLWEVNQVQKQMAKQELARELSRKKRTEGCSKVYRIPVQFYVLYFEEKYRVPPEKFDQQLKCTNFDMCVCFAATKKVTNSLS